MKILKQQNKQSPKTVMFYNRDLINVITDEEAFIENTMPSVIIENCILTQLLPMDELLQKKLSDVYTNNISIKQMLIDVFSDLGKDNKEKKRKEENQKLVNLLYEEVFVNLNEELLQFNKTYEFSLNENMRSLITCLRSKYADNKEAILIFDAWDVQSKNIEINTVRWCNMLFNFLLFNWDKLYSLTYTYKVLSDVFRMADESIFDDFSLYELRKTLQNIEKNWNID